MPSQGVSEATHTSPSFYFYYKKLFFKKIIRLRASLPSCRGATSSAWPRRARGRRPPSSGRCSGTSWTSRGEMMCSKLEYGLGGVVAQSFGNKHFLTKKCKNRWFLGNYSSLSMHDIEQCGTFQHCPRSKLRLRPILTILQKLCKQKKATEKFAPKHLYGLRCIFSCVWNDRLLRGDGPIGLVLAPTRELAMQIYAEAKKFGKVYDLQVNVLFFYYRNTILVGKH